MTVNTCHRTEEIHVTTMISKTQPIMSERAFWRVVAFAPATGERWDRLAFPLFIIAPKYLGSPFFGFVLSFLEDIVFLHFTSLIVQPTICVI